MRDKHLSDVQRPADSVQPTEKTRPGTVLVRRARYTCTVCLKRQWLDYDLIDGREPDSAELDAQARARLRWRINGYCWGPRRATTCSDACAEAYLQTLAEPRPEPETQPERKNEQEPLWRP